MHGNAEQLARGAQKASYTQATRCPLAYDIQMGLTEEEIKEKYDLGTSSYETIINAYLEGNDELLSQYQTKSVVAAEAVVHVDDPIILPEATKSEFVYSAKPRLDQILVKRVSKEHSSQLIIPDAYKDNSDVGTIVSVGPLVEDLAKGQLVMFDKYATVGQSVNLIDDDGDEVEMLLMKSVNVQLTLQRHKREE